MDHPGFGSTACECFRSQPTGSRLDVDSSKHRGRKRKVHSPDRCRFFDNARGSALESAACLDVLVAKRFFGTGEIEPGKAMLVRIVSMLFGLIRANSDTRVFEEPGSYQAGAEKQTSGRSKIRNTNTSKNQNRINSRSATG